MKTILYATDFSDNSVTALKYANSVSNKMNAKLVVTYVFELPIILNSKIEETYIHFEENALEKHNNALEEFCKEHLGGDFDEKKIKFDAIDESSVANGIISKVIELGAFMVITGMKGKSAITEFFMGSVTKQLFEISPCPVLAIPENADFTKINTIVYASDFEKDDINALNKIAAIAKAFDSKIKVVHISSKKEYKGEEQMEWFKEMVHQKEKYKKIEFDVVFSEDIFESLLKYLDEEKADMVVMLERDKSFNFRTLFRKDLVKKMESYGKIPLMSFNEE